MFQTDAVVDPCVVDEGVEAAVGGADVLDRGAAGFEVVEFGDDEFAREARALELLHELVDAGRDPAEDDDLCAFGEAGASDGFADAGGAAGDEDDAVFETEIHDEELSSD